MICLSIQLILLVIGKFNNLMCKVYSYYYFSSIICRIWYYHYIFLQNMVSFIINDYSFDQSGQLRKQNNL